MKGVYMEKFTVNSGINMTTDENGEIEINFNFKDSDGSNINITEKGDNLTDVMETIIDKIANMEKQKKEPTPEERLASKVAELQKQTEQLRRENMMLKQRINDLSAPKETPVENKKEDMSSLQDFINNMFGNHFTTLL
jgi:regulator of replication initiation timing